MTGGHEEPPLGNRAPIGVFDSGLGGLAVLRSMREAMASEDFIYMADSAYAPYGDRSPEWILHRSAAICEFLLQEGAKALVVACNTATTVAVRALRERFSPVPIVAIEPAVKPAAALTRSGVVGVMATSRTIGSAQFAHLREQYGRGLSILGQACPGLADLVEAGRFDDDELHQQVAHYVEPLIARGADTLVLGCTHYTFLRPIIQSVGGPAVTIVDPAIAVANEVVRRLREAQLLSDARGRGHTMFFTSGRPVRVGAVLERLWPPGGVVYRAPGLAGGD